MSSPVSRLCTLWHVRNFARSWSSRCENSIIIYSALSKSSRRLSRSLQPVVMLAAGQVLRLQPFTSLSAFAVARPCPRSRTAAIPVLASHSEHKQCSYTHHSAGVPSWPHEDNSGCWPKRRCRLASALRRSVLRVSSRSSALRRRHESSYVDYKAKHGSAGGELARGHAASTAAQLAELPPGRVVMGWRVVDCHTGADIGLVREVNSSSTLSCYEAAAHRAVTLQHVLHLGC